MPLRLFHILALPVGEAARQSAAAPMPPFAKGRRRDRNVNPPEAQLALLKNCHVLPHPALRATFPRWGKESTSLRFVQ